MRARQALCQSRATAMGRHCHALQIETRHGRWPHARPHAARPHRRSAATGDLLLTGLVGMPNVGKSTTFNLMCSMSVPAENFPVRP